MLAYKAWRESQARFLLSAGALVWFCSIFLFLRHGVRGAEDNPYAEFVAGNIFGGGIRSLYVTFVAVLGLGGLLQERAHGSAVFTLALPVRRAHMVAVRAATGAVEVGALALVPALAVSLLSPLVQETYPVTAALRLSGQWAVGGAVVFSVALLLSVMLGGPFSALAAAMAALFVYALIVNVPVVREFPMLNLFAFMTADRSPVPAAWLGLLAVATAMVAVAAWITERQDF